MSRRGAQYPNGRGADRRLRNTSVEGDAKFAPPSTRIESPA
ncbi:MAG: hypothetical protein JWP52_1655 [Rhizobacter sp.]|nr:hypothetical protein [Rhizobacter sp.]